MSNWSQLPPLECWMRRGGVDRSDFLIPFSRCVLVVNILSSGWKIVILIVVNRA